MKKIGYFVDTSFGVTSKVTQGGCLLMGAFFLMSLASPVWAETVHEKSKQLKSESSGDPCTAKTPSARQKKMINFALNNRSDESEGMCARYVKNAMSAGYPEMPRQSCDAFDLDIEYKLTANGFSKCSYVDPRKAAPGCLVIYDSYGKIGTMKSTPPKRSSMRVAFPAKDLEGKVITRSGRTVVSRGKKVTVDKYVPYYGHIEVVTDSAKNPYVSDFGQKTSVINGSPSDLANGWGFNRTKSREYKVIGVFCKR